MYYGPISKCVAERRSLLVRPLYFFIFFYNLSLFIVLSSLCSGRSQRSLKEGRPLVLQFSHAQFITYLMHKGHFQKPDYELPLLFAAGVHCGLAVPRPRMRDGQLGGDGGVLQVQTVVRQRSGVPHQQRCIP